MSKRYRTAWPHVTIKVMDEATGRPTIVAFGLDVIVPLSADQDDVKRLAAKGALVAEPEPAVEKAADTEDAATAAVKRVSAKSAKDTAAKESTDKND